MLCGEVNHIDCIAVAKQLLETRLQGKPDSCDAA